MDFDRQAIERRDFPIGRRGYDPASVDAHLRALGEEVETLQRAAGTATGDLSLASTAGTQVQSILAAAEAAASEIERQALDAAREAREAADRDADRTRAEAIEKARAHVAAVAAVTATLLERVGAMDGEVRAFAESMRAGAGRLAGDLTAVETNMAELYDAASGAAYAEPAEGPRAPAPATGFDAELQEALTVAEQPAQPFATPASDPAEMAPPADDLDGARLIALNMALNGEPRAETERYLAENFQLPDRVKLIDEVYAAIEA